MAAALVHDGAPRWFDVGLTRESRGALYAYLSIFSSICARSAALLRHMGHPEYPTAKVPTRPVSNSICLLGIIAIEKKGSGRLGFLPTEAVYSGSGCGAAHYATKARYVMTNGVDCSRVLQKGRAQVRCDGGNRPGDNIGDRRKERGELST